MPDTEIKKKNSYELYMLLSPVAIDGNVSAVEENISRILQKHHAQIERSEKFTRKDLAYPIKKFGYAYSANIYFFAPTEAIDEIQKEFSTSEIPFLRLMITKIDKRPKTRMTPRRVRPKIALEEKKAVGEILEKELKIEIPEESVPKTESYTAKEVKTEEKEKDKNKVTLEDIDKRLDEIMEQL